MIPIRTGKGKMFGTLDTATYKLYIKDGSTTRAIKVPESGTELEYIMGNNPPELVYIPPKAA